MPIPFLSTLNALARQAYPLIKAGVAQGLSSRAIDVVLKSAFGKSIRRSTLLEVMRRESGVERIASQLKFLRLDRLPNPLRLPPAITRLRRQYSFLVEVTGHLIDTGEIIKQHITIATDTLRTRQELQNLAINTIEGEKERYGIDIIGAQLISGKRAGDMGIL